MDVEPLVQSELIDLDDRALIDLHDTVVGTTSSQSISAAGWLS